MQITEHTTIEEFLQEARRLRKVADDAEVAFLSFLYAGEKAARHIWDGAGKTYVEFLQQQNLCMVTRYLRYKKVADTLGEEKCEGVGGFAVVAAGALKDASHQAEVLDQARIWEETNGTSISEQSAQAIVKSVKTRTAAVRTRGKGYAALAAENERLKEQVASLKSELKSARAEIRRLKSKPKVAKKARAAA